MNTQENNKLIAEFMQSIEDGLYLDGLYFHKAGYYDTNMEFHTSWDWLMPVIKKISDIKSWSINATLEWLSESQDRDGLYTKEDVYESVVEFINQYNK